jgi:hypothetical protein
MEFWTAIDDDSGGYVAAMSACGRLGCASPPFATEAEAAAEQLAAMRLWLRREVEGGLPLATLSAPNLPGWQIAALYTDHARPVEVNALALFKCCAKCGPLAVERARISAELWAQAAAESLAWLLS